MMNGFDDMQKLSKDSMDVMMQSFGAMTKGMQAIATEVADYQKKSFEESSAALEKQAEFEAKHRDSSRYKRYKRWKKRA